MALESQSCEKCHRIGNATIRQSDDILYETRWNSESFKTYPPSYILEKDQVEETVQDRSFRFSEFSTATAHTRNQTASATRKEENKETYTDEHDEHGGLGLGLEISQISQITNDNGVQDETNQDLIYLPSTPTKSMFNDTCQNSGETEKSQGHPPSRMEKVGVAEQQEERPKKVPNVVIRRDQIKDTYSVNQDNTSLMIRMTFNTCPRTGKESCKFFGSPTEFTDLVEHPLKLKGSWLQTKDPENYKIFKADNAAINW